MTYLTNILGALILISTYTNSVAQTDTTFWFSAPDISEDHGDRPTYFRFATFDLAATVKITLPSTNTEITTLQIPSNSQISYLVENPDLLETQAGNIQNNGIKIESSAPITAYYEVLGPSRNNADIFTLKGKYALGKEFIAPIQNLYPNITGLDAYNTIQIVATENNTIVQIYPTTSVLIYDNQSPITISLNKGQTYSLQPSDSNQKLTGTRITSNKSIAVTISDDSVLYGDHWDLVGDQLIPFTIAGTKYVLPIGHISISSKNDLQLSINGNNYQLNSANNHSATFYNDTPILLEATDTVVINYIDAFYDLADGGGELGGAILPPISCSGSREVAFIRSSTEDFWIHLIYRTSSQNDFTLNGNPLNVTTDIVYQIDENLSYTKIKYDETQLPSAASYRLKNSSAPFHVATASGGIITGFQLGYFTNFKNELEDTIYLCEQYVNIEDFYQDLQLYGDIVLDTITEINTTSSLVQFSTEDEYCTTTDTAVLINSTPPQINIESPINLCTNKDSTISIEAHKVIFNDFYQNNDYLIAEENIKIYAENNVGCSSIKNITVNYLDTLVHNIPSDTFFCKGTTINIPITHNALTALANDQFLDNLLTISTDSTINIVLENNCGIIEKTLRVNQVDLPIFNLGPDREICSTNNPIVTLPELYSYVWTDGTTENNISFSESGTYSVIAKNNFGCTYQSEVTVLLKTIDSINVIKDQKICLNNLYEVNLPIGHDQYLWNANLTEPSRNLDTGFYQVEILTYVNDTICYQNSFDFNITRWNLKIPNVITPNGDTKNETFKILGLDQNFPLELTIFNRWGKEIYYSPDYKNTWGDDESISTGVYYYNTKSNNYNCTINKGYLTVIK